MKVYVVKFALTSGIVESDFEPTDGGYGFVRLFGSPYKMHISKKHYAYCLEEAVQMAESMRAKKIASHEKAIQKLKSLKITVK